MKLYALYWDYYEESYIDSIWDSREAAIAQITISRKIAHRGNRSLGQYMIYEYELNNPNNLMHTVYEEK